MFALCIVCNIHCLCMNLLVVNIDVLLSPFLRGQLKLGDFGLARYYHATDPRYVHTYVCRDYVCTSYYACVCVLMWVELGHMGPKTATKFGPIWPNFGGPNLVQQV